MVGSFDCNPYREKPMRISCLALAATICVFALPAFADSGKDCAPLGSLPSYSASTDGPNRRDYMAADFDVKQSDDSSKTVSVAGRYM